MRDLLRQRLDEARRSAEGFGDRSLTSSTLSTLCAESVRLARVASALHMTQAAGLLHRCAITCHAEQAANRIDSAAAAATEAAA